MSSPASPNVRRRRAVLGAAIEAVFVLGPDQHPLCLACGAAPWLVNIAASFTVALYPARQATRLAVAEAETVLIRGLSHYFEAAGHPHTENAMSWLMPAIRIMAQRPFCDVVVEPHAVSSDDGWPDIDRLRAIASPPIAAVGVPENGRTLEYS